jgi:chitinase
MELESGCEVGKELESACSWCRIGRRPVEELNMCDNRPACSLGGTRPRCSRTASGRRGNLGALFRKEMLWLLVVAGCLCSRAARADVWCTAYYPGYEQGYMPASNIDFTAISHIIHFSLVPNSDGSLDSSANSITTAYSADLISRAHAAHKKVLICVGGAGTSNTFLSATSPGNLSTFIRSLTNFMSSRGYDGIDIDWEPLDGTEAGQYTNLVNGLRAAMNPMIPRPLLTAPIASPPTPPSLVAQVQNQFDQINLMTYDLSGPWPGWVTWFNSPIYDGGYVFPSTGGLVPSVDDMVTGLATNGVALSKLAIGIAFYGDVWSGGGGTSTGGVSEPRQSWTTVPTLTQERYGDIMSTYYQPNLYHWDLSAQAAYLSIDNPGSNNDSFISYDDQRTCQSKVSYARNRRLGGVMIWELSQDHQPGQPDPLLQAVKQALASPGQVTARPSEHDMNISFTSMPLGSYCVAWTSNVSAGMWNTLIITNMTGTGGVIQVTDPGALSQPRRFYRIQTPP